MSFSFEWPRFSDQFHTDAIHMLNNALNKGNKPPVIADKIEVVELEMGTVPPELEIRDIGDLTVDHFRGIFRLTYAGDAHIVLKTKVQANPLNHKQPDIHNLAGSRGMLAAKEPLVVPMLLRLSHFKLNSYVVLVVSRQKGITLVFKTDPLQNVDINSTFDSIAVIQKFIQREIEGQLRQMFREDLPGIIHRLSQQWIKAKVEAPYLANRPPPSSASAAASAKASVRRATKSNPDVPPLGLTADIAGMGLGAGQALPLGISAVGLQQHLARQQSLGAVPRSPASVASRSAAAASSASRARPHSYHAPSSYTGRSPASLASAPLASSSSPRASPRPKGSTPPNGDAGSSSQATFPDIENFDPTYGLRPEGLPNKSLFSSFGRLFTPNKGLADLTEEPSEEEDEGIDEEEEEEDEFFDDSQSFDAMQDWDSTYHQEHEPGDEDDADVRNGSILGLGLGFGGFGSGGGRGGGGGMTASPLHPPEYETLPAVGGGTITRPRVYHSQSLITSPTESPLGIGLAQPFFPHPHPPSRAGTPSRVHMGTSSAQASPRRPPARSTAASSVMGGSNPYFAVPPGALAQEGRIPRTRSEPAFDIDMAGVPPHMHPQYQQHQYHAQQQQQRQRPYGLGNGYAHGASVPVTPRFRSRTPESMDTQASSLTQSQSLATPSSSSLFDIPAPRPVLPPPSLPALDIPGSPIQPQTQTQTQKPPHLSARRMSSASTSARSDFIMRSTSPNYSIAGGGGGGGDPVVLRPNLDNSTLHHLSTLSQSNHTLSPYTRSLAHFAVRSGPPRPPAPSVSVSAATPGRSLAFVGAASAGLGRSRKAAADDGEMGHPTKARRRRVHRLGGKKGGGGSGKAKADADADAEQEQEQQREREREQQRMLAMLTSPSPPPPPEFDQADIDMYFRTRDERDPDPDRSLDSTGSGSATTTTRKSSASSYAPSSLEQGVGAARVYAHSPLRQRQRYS